jgi:hypothetical protein
MDENRGLVRCLRVLPHVTEVAKPLTLLNGWGSVALLLNGDLILWLR